MVELEELDRRRHWFEAKRLENAVILQLYEMMNTAKEKKNRFYFYIDVQIAFRL